MSVTAFTALGLALVGRLSNAGVWGAQVYMGRKDAGATYPYLVYFWTGGGERNAVRKRDAELSVAVKVVSRDLQEALTGAQQIADLLNDHGKFDNATDYLDGGTYWNILTITQEEDIPLLELFESVYPIYHQGAQYTVIMEEV